jgi:YD repeat-containing protein
VTWNVCNPDGASASNRLWLTESRSGGVSRDYHYAWTNRSGVAQWLLTETGNLREVWGWEKSTGSQTNQFFEVLSGGATIQMEQRTYDYVAGSRRLAAMLEGTSSLTNLTRYAYYSSDATNGAATNLLKQVEYPDGSWEYYQYDNYRRVAYKYTSWRDEEPAGVSGASPSDPKGRLTEYGYGDIPTTLGANAAYTANSEQYYLPINPGCILVGKSARIFGSNYVEEVRYADPYSASGLTNRTTYFTTGYAATRVHWTRHADGTGSVLGYTFDSNGALTNVLEATGEWGTTNILNGALSESVYDGLGRLLSRTRWQLTAGAAGPVVEQQTYAYSGDPLLRNYQVVDLGNRTNSYQYACCGLEATTDPDGVRMHYVYDALKRRVMTERIASGQPTIQVTNILDAAGRVLAAKQMAGGSSIDVVRYEYDVLGRVTKETNALGGVTSYVEESGTNGLRLRTTTLPDGGTRVEEFYRGGRPYRLTGNTTSAEQREYGVEVNDTIWSEFTKTTKLDADANTTDEWTKTYSDGLGRPYKTLYADGAFTMTAYNTLGQTAFSRNPDAVTNYYYYNGQGEQTNNTVGIRVFTTETAVVTNHGSVVLAHRRYSGEGSSRLLLAETESAVDGLRSWQTVYTQPGVSLLSSNATAYARVGYRYTTNTAPDGSCVVSVFRYGQLQSVTRKLSAASTQLGSTTYGYDAFGRVQSSTDARNGTTWFYLNACTGKCWWNFIGSDRGLTRPSERRCRL